MTSEPEALTERWVEQHGVKYAYAYDKASALARQVGVTGIPDAILLNPAGEIVWRGHPANLRGESIDRHLEGALELPVGNWPEALSSVKRDLLDRDYADAVQAVSKLVDNDPSLARYRDIIQAIVDRKVEQLESDLAKGDYLGAQEAGKQLERQLKGLPEADRVDAVLDKIRKDRGARAIINAQKTLARLRGVEVRKKIEALGLIRQAERIADRFPGTFVGTEAREFVDRLKKLAETLR